MKHKTMVYSPELHHRSFQEGVLKSLHYKLWKISRKTYEVEFPLNKIERLTSTALPD